MEDCELETAAPLRPQSFLFGCELKADEKEYRMEVDDDDSEHQLSLRTVCLGAGASDDLHLVEAEGLNFEGKSMKVTFAALKLSVQPTVSLGGFEIAPPVTFRLKSGAGPVYISGQHLIALDDDDDLESDEEDDSMLEKAIPKQALKRAAAAPSKIMQKKMRVEDDDDDDEDDEDDEDDDEDDEDEEVVVTRVKKQKTPLKGTPNQNGKTPTKSTPAANKQSKTPESKKPSSKPQTPKTPKGPMTIEEIMAKLKASLEKGAGLPKLEPKFKNYIRHGYRTDDPKIIKELWAWRQTLDGK